MPRRYNLRKRDKNVKWIEDETLKDKEEESESEDEDYEPESETEDDEEYELTQRSRDSQIIDVEKFGLVMILMNEFIQEINGSNVPFSKIPGLLKA